MLMRNISNNISSLFSAVFWVNKFYTFFCHKNRTLPVNLSFPIYIFFNIIAMIKKK